jgi:hypothetical protein
VEVMNVNRVVYDVVTEVVGLTDGEPRLNAASS